ncbi:MAG: hypothetical protein KJ043_10820, partial [Anaerolineae bacterium]|nr:hypothetical protein [Anaerolineae bacterium]
RNHIGKTAFLHQLVNTASHHSIGVFISLADFTLDDEDQLWVMTSQIILDTLAWYQIIIPELPSDESARVWFVSIFLPTVIKALRGRDLFLLWDDAHQLLNENLPDDLFETLRGLCSPSIQMIFAFDIAYEDQIGQFMPFIKPKHQLRLGNLSLAGCEAVLGQYQSGLGAEMVKAIYEATGGLPHLLHHYGAELGQYADIKTLNNAVYERVKGDYLAIWTSRSADEKLVLTAIADLFYDDPLRPITNAHIATWSTKSDYLLDETAINAALRGLVYDELVLLENHHIRVNGDLWRKWLLEHARISGDKSNKRKTVPMSLIISTLVVVIIAVLLILSIFGGGLDGGVTIPTITPTS